jgi:hypothetical protein
MSTQTLAVLEIWRQNSFEISIIFCAVQKKSIDVSQGPTASIFRVEEEAKHETVIELFYDPGNITPCVGNLTE